MLLSSTWCGATTQAAGSRQAERSAKQFDCESDSLFAKPRALRVLAGLECRWIGDGGHNREGNTTESPTLHKPHIYTHLAAQNLIPHH